MHVLSKEAAFGGGPSLGAAILLAADDLPVRRDLEELLEPLGHRVYSSTSDEAIAISAIEDLLLVIADERTSLRLFARGALRCPVIVFLLGDATPARAIDAHATGATDVVFHPLDGDAFRSKVAAYVRLHERVARTIMERESAERATLLGRERRARAAAEAASRAKDEFLATVSHELRNPLNAILGWARMLVEEPDVDGERMRKGLDVILRNAKAQVQLVDDILDVSRIVTGKLRLSASPVDVAVVAEAAVETVRTAAQAKRVALECDVTNAGCIVADEDRLQQILWNLLSNAVKFTPAGGAVRLHARRGSTTVEISVVDTGEGIDPDFLPFVFDRFRQFDGSTTRTHGGLGLGLAVVRHLVELHGGTITVASEGRGRGARFTLALPVASAELEEKRPSATSLVAASAEPGKPLAGRSVLVLDDDADMRDLLTMILQDAGATVLPASTVRAALGLVERERPDVAISDLAMPGEDGYAFVAKVRASPVEPVRATPLVAMTAYARADDRRRVLAAGFDRHVAKPIEPQALVEALVMVLEGVPSRH